MNLARFGFAVLILLSSVASFGQMAIVSELQIEPETVAASDITGTAVPVRYRAILIANSTSIAIVGHFSFNPSATNAVNLAAFQQSVILYAKLSGVTIMASNIVHIEGIIAQAEATAQATAP